MYYSIIPFELILNEESIRAVDLRQDIKSGQSLPKKLAAYPLRYKQVGLKIVQGK